MGVVSGLFLLLLYCSLLLEFLMTFSVCVNVFPAFGQGLPESSFLFRFLKMCQAQFGCTYFFFKEITSIL